MSKKLYVGNLSYGVDEAALQNLFSAYGTVTSVKIITDSATNRSKGFGFVEMSDDSAAAEAVNALDGTEQDGRTIRVAEARPRQDEGRGGGGGGGGGFRGRGPRRR